MPRRLKGATAGGTLRALAALFLLAVAGVPALAQETPDQFNAANAEIRRYSEAQNQLRNQAHDLRNDQTKALLTCQGAGSPAAQSACESNVGIDARQHALQLGNQTLQQNNSHNVILKGIGVHRVP